jgi:homoserine acetyltransferase
MSAHITYLSDAALHRKFGRNLQDRPSVSYGFGADFAGVSAAGAPAASGTTTGSSTNGTTTGSTAGSTTTGPTYTQSPSGNTLGPNASPSGPTLTPTGPGSGMGR